MDSVLKQEYKDFELFLINDGSSDKTREICERYAAADDRVLVIHKENSGVSESRNMAIAQAHGEYLQFLDCDDWISTGCDETSGEGGKRGTGGSCDC